MKKRSAIKWCIYWAIVLVGYVGISLYWRSFAAFAAVPALAALVFAVHMVFALVSGRVRNRWICIGLRLLSILASAAAMLTFVALVFLNGSNYNRTYVDSMDYSVFEPSSADVRYDSETGVYTLRATKGELRILQLTDIHLGSAITTVSDDRKALNACYETIRAAQPDLIIVTGDIAYATVQTVNRNNLKPIYQFAYFLNRVGIPWALTYGNHDTESFTAYNYVNLEGLFRNFRQDPDCPMLYADKQPDIYGRYNQYLRIENADGSLNRILFLIDSNDYVRDSAKVNDYDWIHTDQIDWYADTVDAVSAELGQTVRSFVFMHIPLPEFAEAKAALDAGSPDAQYLFGENEEDCSPPDYNSGFFARILEKGSTDAVFVGHNHLNNMGIRYQGVDLVFGKSIDYIAYPGIGDRTAQRGGTLIRVLPDGSYRIGQVDYNK